MDCHGYIVCKCCVVESRQRKKECDLNNVRQKRNSAFPQSREPCPGSDRKILVATRGAICTGGIRLGECKLLRQAVEKDGEKLEECQESARMWIARCDPFQGNRIAGHTSQSADWDVLHETHLQQPPKTKVSVVIQSARESIRLDEVYGGMIKGLKLQFTRRNTRSGLTHLGI